MGSGEPTRGRPMKVLVVDDHVLIREALGGVLRELQGDVVIVEAPDSRRAVQRIAEHPDLELILLDPNLPDRSGFELLAELRARHPAVSVVMISASDERDDIARALELGALGFIPKSAEREVMLGAFKLIFSGGIYVPPEILGRTNGGACEGLRLPRRSVLKLALATALAPRSGGAGEAATGERILRRRIPGTDETLPAVGLGTSDEFETGAVESLGPLREVLRRFVELGGRLVDTAPVYGNAEEVLGRLMGELGVTEPLFVASKVRAYGEETGIEQMRRSERLLGKRPLDLLQVHSLVDVRTQLENLRRWKETGRVRHIGITHSCVSAFDALERLMRDEPLDFVQLNYSFTEPQAEERLLPLAADRGIAVIANRPFENGALFRRVRGRPLPEWAAEFDCTSWAQFSLKYILGHPAVTCVIPATSNPEHVVDNVRAGLDRLPDQRTRGRMRRLGASL